MTWAPERNCTLKGAETMTDETKARTTMRTYMEELAKTWETFSEVYHTNEFVDAEHAFGVLVREYHELLERVRNIQNLIKEFEDKQLGNHYYADTGKLMMALKTHAVSAAEEAVQIAAVAMKTIQSGFVKGSDGK